MRLDNILVCMKRTLLEQIRRKHTFKELILKHGRASPAFEKIYKSHEQTIQARKVTLQILQSSGLHYKTLTRPESVDESDFDLAVVVGGDGTILDYARHLRKLPILGVNSSPDTSVGRFHYTNVNALQETLDMIRQHRVDPMEVVRLNVIVDGIKKPFPALNEVLFAHKNPAATSKYTIIVGDTLETQRSSGVWIATAAGSSGAILSAGGNLQSMGDTGLQYRVREKFISPLDKAAHKLLGGHLPEGHIEFIDRMLEGAVFLDGIRGMYYTGYWSRVEINSKGPKLNIFLRDK